MDTRIGFGYDIHPLVKGKNLFLGGLKIPSEIGLEGHSDADVLLHAICDAILGAISHDDIGEHFPDSDKKLKNIRSTRIYEEIKGMVSFDIINIDTTIITEFPKISPYRKEIRRNIAEMLGVDIERVSVKAKTNEGLGLIGKKKAIACFAIVLLRIR